MGDKSRWNELLDSLGLNILLPNFCLWVLLPCAILVCLPAPPDLPFLLLLLAPGYVRTVCATSLLLFGLSMVTNLSISRHLRRHQTPESPYSYEARSGTRDDPAQRSRFFRIQVAVRPAFNRLLDDLRRGKGKVHHG